MFDFVNQAQPKIPASKTNPVGQTQRIGKSMQAVRRDIAQAKKVTLETVASWPYQRVANAKYFYEFGIDKFQVERLIEIIEDVLANGGGADEVRRSAEGAYKEGLARFVDNIKGLTQDYPWDVSQRLQDQPVLRRAAFAGSRAYEQMEGFAGQTGKDLARVIFQAILDGENPRQTAKTIRERFRVSRSRAERIARTEITMAHRRGRWDEAREAENKFGIKTKLLHNSALIFGRTRTSHAARHGNLYTREEESTWYAKNGNAINCLCSQTEVVVDEKDKPIFGDKLMDRMKKQRNQFLGVETKTNRRRA